MNKHLFHMKQLSLVLIAAMLILAGCAGSYYHAGNRNYKQTAYDVATKRYEKALSMKPDAKWAPDAKHKLADAYHQMRNTADAEKWYKEVVDMPDATAQERLIAAKTMMGNEHYADARVQLKQYMDQVPNDQNAQKLYASLDSIAIWKADSSYVITSANLNAAASNLSPTYFKEGVLFATDRGTKKKYEWTGRPFLDMYYAKETAPNTFDPAVKLPGKINGVYHDGPACASADGKTIYFTRTSSKGSALKRNKKTGEVNFKIYQATLAGDDWTDIKELPFNSNDFSNGHPALSADGNTLYFTSNMPGGQGGTDIWMAGKRGEDWGTPQNLGSAVNTSMNEMFPTVNGSDLYFSSEGHYNMGGLDIFRTRFESGAWSTPANVGYPANTAHDDFGMITKGNFLGYLTSNRNSTDGKIDNILGYKEVEIFFDLSVLAVNKSENMSPLSGVNVELLNKTTGEKETTVTGADGKAKFKLKQNTDYTVLGSKAGFFSNSAEVSTVGKVAGENMDITLVLEMEVMKVNEPITIKNIYYDFDKANIRSDAAKELDGLVKKMQDNPTIVVELASHTDSRGSATYNQRLSQRRAQAAVNYIVSKGIDKKKITAKGYGETKLLNNCKDGVKCSDSDHQLNRRTEFTVTGFTDQKEPIKSTK